jgi:hypothetical protein
VLRSFSDQGSTVFLANSFLGPPIGLFFVVLQNFAECKFVFANDPMGCPGSIVPHGFADLAAIVFFAYLIGWLPASLTGYFAASIVDRKGNITYLETAFVVLALSLATAIIFPALAIAYLGVVSLLAALTVRGFLGLAKICD